jgi:hypothetical protein
MKPLSLLTLLLCSCTVTQVTTPNWSLHRTSLLQKMEVPSVRFTANGEAEMSGYKSDGGADTAAVITAAAVSAAINAH